MIPFIDLKKQYLSMKDEIDGAIGRVLETSQFILGGEVAAFEKDFAVYCRTRFAIGVNSGTSALHLALLAAGVGPGDEVITVSMTFVATVAAIGYTGARPVLIDIDPHSLTMNPDRLEEAITPRTKAIVPVHLYGQPADMDPIMEVARRHGLVVIEDACQAHGAQYKGRRAGSIGDLGCFSFYPGKNLGACGEGGLVVTNDEAYQRKIRMLRDWGAARKYEHQLKGYNFRMEGLQGAVLKAKLAHLEDWTEARRRHAAQYDVLLADLPEIQRPEAMPGVRHVYHVYAIRTPWRDELRQELEARQIQTGIHYPIPVHLLEAHADLGYQVGDFPVTEQLAREELSLPMFAELEDEQVAAVAEAVQESLRSIKEKSVFTVETLSEKAETLSEK